MSIKLVFADHASKPFTSRGSKSEIESAHFEEWVRAAGD